MKKTFFLIFLALGSLFVQSQARDNAKNDIRRVEPLNWWTGMKTPLTIMVYGDNLADSEVLIQKQVGKRIRPTDGLILRGQHNAENPNYLFIDLYVREAGDYIINLKKGRKSTKFTYHIGERREGSAQRKSFTEADVIYLIMSDRFVDGDPSNNSTADTREKCNKESLDGRWGGDIQGIINSLDYISSLGATAIWPTPLLLDDEEAWSYHGYACSDYYHIDPRFGTNELYKEMVKKAHEKGLKIIYVGDKAQLPPVKESKVSKVFRDSKTSVIELTKVERTGDNAILKEATDLRNGKELSEVSSFNKEGKGVAYMHSRNGEEIRKIINRFTPGLKSNPDFFRILTYTNASVQRYNMAVRNALGYTGVIPRVGEPLMGYANWGYEGGAKASVKYRWVNSEDAEDKLRGCHRQQGQQAGGGNPRKDHPGTTVACMEGRSDKTGERKDNKADQRHQRFPVHQRHHNL